MGRQTIVLIAWLYNIELDKLYSSGLICFVWTENALVNFLISVILGLIAAATGFGLLQGSAEKLKIQDITNIVIALATVAAVAINCLLIRSQKESRRWEVNKDLLLKLSTTLSDLMTQTVKLSDDAFCVMQGVPRNHESSYDGSIYLRFEKYLEHAINVYSALLNKEIVLSIEKYRESSSKIIYAHDIGEFNDFEAYEAFCVAQEELMKILSKNIKRYASV